MLPRAGRVVRRHEWVALAALVVVSTALRAWAALKVPVPWIAPDEMVYGLLGRGLWLHGSLDILGGPTPYYSLLTPLLAGFPLAAFGASTGYDVLHGLQAFVMSLAAVPAYFWARSLVSRRGAFGAAALTVATPVLAYSGLVMTEVLFYPLLVAAAWAGAEAIARPTRKNQMLLLVAFVAVCATRIQGIVLVPALVTAVLLDGAIGRSWGRLRRHLPAAAGFGVLLGAWVAWRLASGGATLGGYGVTTDASYSVGMAAKFVLYHGASLLILSALFPVIAVMLKLVEALRRGENDERVRAYLAVAASLTVWVVVEVGVFASRYADRQILERNLIPLAPLLFVGLVLWLERGPDGGYIERGVIAALAIVVLVLLPVNAWVTTVYDAMTLVPLYKLSTATSTSTLTWVYRAAVVAVPLVFVLVPRRHMRWLPVVLVVVLVGASVSASRFVIDQGRLQQRTFLGDDPSWADNNGGKRIAYLYDGESSWPGVWETLFWNERIDRVYDLGDVEVSGPLPQTHLTIQADGHVTGLPTNKRKAKYAVASNWVELAGKPVARIAQQGLTQTGLVLWKLNRSLRIRSRTSGLQPNGDIYGPATGELIAYGCREGTFQITMIVKQPETVDVKVNRALVQHLTYDGPTTAHLDLPAKGHNGMCQLTVTPSGLLGTTVFQFDPA